MPDVSHDAVRADDSDDQPLAWFAGDPDLSGEYLVGIQDVIDAGQPFGGGPDPATYSELVTELGDPFRPLDRRRTRARR